MAAPVRIVKLFSTFSEALSCVVDFYVSKDVSWGCGQGRYWQDTRCFLASRWIAQPLFEPPIDYD